MTSKSNSPSPKYPIQVRDWVDSVGNQAFRFAESFEPYGINLVARGPYDIVASHRTVSVVRFTATNGEDFERFIAALRLAQKVAKIIST